eukprot:tig00001600_g9388.t1
MGRHGLLAAAIVLLGLVTVVRANIVLDWNAAFCDVLKTSAPDWDTGRVARAGAMLHIAIADAYEDASRLPAQSLRGVTRGAAAEAAVAFAAHDVLAAVLPSSQWDLRLRDFVAAARPSASTPDPGLEAAARVGSRAARRVLEERVDDHSNAFAYYAATNGPGRWRPTPPLFKQMPQSPAWRLVTPFSGKPHAFFALEHGPPDLFSREYAAAVALTQELGARESPTRTEGQTELAYFWADSAPGRDSRPAHWNRIAATIAQQQQMSLRDTAKFFRLVNVALADVSIADKVNKFKFDQWRPVTAIREGVNGNEFIRAQPDWTPLMDTENSQEYPSAHAACAAALVHVISKFLPSLSFPPEGLAVTSDSPMIPPGVVRTYQSLDEIVEEVAMSRVYAGNHFSFSVAAGRVLGIRAGEAAWAHHERLEKGRPALSSSAPGDLPL